MEFKPILRFAVMSDLHYQEDKLYVRDRFKRAMEILYNYSSNNDYNKLDALYVVGDFTNLGETEQFEMFYEDCEAYVKKDTKLVVTLANHELHYVPDCKKALDDFKRIYKMPYDLHQKIGGYHFISLSTTRDKGIWHDSFNDEKKAFLKAELEAARADTGNKPIFVFQHPGIPGTLAGGSGGHTEIYSILSDYPQVIDFSGHSHNAVNDPREINQKHFTTVGIGSLHNITTAANWFDYHIQGGYELGMDCAHMRVVEVDNENRVRILGLDVISGNFISEDYIEDCHDKTKYKYTAQRARTTPAPYFDKDAFVKVIRDENNVRVTFPRAKSQVEPVHEYNVRLIDDKGIIVRQKTVYSDFMFFKQADTVTVEFDETFDFIPKALVWAGGFWDNWSEPIGN